MSVISKPALHAVFVGINKYENLSVQRWLASCHNDANRLRETIEEVYKDDFSSLNVKMIREDIPEAMPTKETIIKAFREDLGKANPGDTALFFFAGHGVRERTAVKSFADAELDGNIGGLALHDFASREKKSPGDTVLADKEIRFLLKELADKGTEEQPIHIVVIFDCCHSGETSRSLGNDSETVRSRQLERAPVGERSLDEFFFASDPALKSKLEAGGSLEEIMPQGDHLMLAACREVDLAWEGGGGNGVFTQALMDILKKNNGDMTYQELHNRILGRMRFVKIGSEFNDLRQTPQLYLKTDELSNRYRNFLTNAPKEVPSYGAVELTEVSVINDAGAREMLKEYRLDLGAFHGIPVHPATPVQVSIYPANDETKVRTAQIKHVFPTHSILDLFGFVPDSNVSWRGKVNTLALPAIRVSILGDQEGVDLASKAIGDALAGMAQPVVELVEETEDSDYTLRASNGRLQIFDSQELARVSYSIYKTPDEKIDQDAPLQQLEFLKQIARWHHYRDLDHKGEFFPEDPRFKHPRYPVEFKAYSYDPQSQTERVIPLTGNTLNIELTPENPTQFVRFELTNRSPNELFVSLVWMTHSFGFLTKGDFRLMHSAQLGLGKMVEPSQGIGEGHVQSSRLGQPMPNGKTYMNLRTGAYIHTDNWPGMQDYLKLIVSEAPFEVEALDLQALPAPDQAVTSSRFMPVDVGPQKPLPKWEVSTYPFYITNPQHRV